ncbi:hypothetical protein PWEIH_08206 [Listeria weihenstephanensis FSL R9-0317]|uniref:Uncharacterized protein n=1 Tax=Listeria weihenstephanensis TaxID=1006155 RepID=A0A1S7FY59_9LIST|nr:hypothetical protein UE46_15930 [Listeria weihenstephanensis]EUJ39004.1 hypothetical protein PWEIH_08206 [Listeria weihenstephanensis FSL R9-0317]
MFKHATGGLHARSALMHIGAVTLFVRNSPNKKNQLGGSWFKKGVIRTEAIRKRGVKLIAVLFTFSILQCIDENSPGFS